MGLAEITDTQRRLALLFGMLWHVWSTKADLLWSAALHSRYGLWALSPKLSLDENVPWRYAGEELLVICK